MYRSMDDLSLDSPHAYQILETFCNDCLKENVINDELRSKMPARLVKRNILLELALKLVGIEIGVTFDVYTENKYMDYLIIIKFVTRKAGTGRNSPKLPYNAQKYRKFISIVDVSGVRV